MLIYVNQEALAVKDYPLQGSFSLSHLNSNQLSERRFYLPQSALVVVEPIV